MLYQKKIVGPTKFNKNYRCNLLAIKTAGTIFFVWKRF